MNKRTVIILTGIFLLVLVSRLVFAFQIPHYSGDEAYFNLRQIEHISQNGVPIFDDPLSYGGRQQIFSPVFHYIISFFSLLSNNGLAAKIVPNVLASSLVILAYLISKRLTKNENVSLFTAFISGFVPIFFSQTVNSISTLSLSIPLMFLLIYCFMNINKKKWLYTYLVTLAIFSFSTPISLVFAFLKKIYEGFFSIICSALRGLA